MIPSSGHRGAAAERPQLPRAGAAGARQRAGAELRSDQDRTACVISSAGQLGRGGNITIDGADNNDDVVGGPLQNVTQESVQEFQIATNRFTAETGRSGSSVINVVTKSGSDQLRGIGVALRCATAAGRGCRRPSIASSGESLPFDRQQMAGSAGGPIVASKAFWFGAAEYRNQDGAVLVGARDVADAHDHAQLRARAARRRPLLRPGRLAASGRVTPSCSATPASTPTDTGASTLDRADRVGVAAAAQREQLQLDRRHVDARSCSRRSLNALTVSFSTFDNAIAPVAGGPAAHLPEHPGRQLVPRPAGHDAAAVPDRRQRHAGPRRAHDSRRRRVAAHRRAVRPRRVPRRPHRDGRGLRRLRPQRRRPRRRQRPALRGDAAQRQAGSGAGHPRRRQQLFRLLRPGRLARPARPDAEPRPALRGATPTSRT